MDDSTKDLVTKEFKIACTFDFINKISSLDLISRPISFYRNFFLNCNASICSEINVFISLVSIIFYLNSQVNIV